MLEWLRQRNQPPDGLPTGARADPLSPMNVYAQEFVAASERSRRLGLGAPAVRFLVR